MHIFKRVNFSYKFSIVYSNLNVNDLYLCSNVLGITKIFKLSMSDTLTCHTKSSFS